MGCGCGCFVGNREFGFRDELIEHRHELGEVGHGRGRLRVGGMGRGTGEGAGEEQGAEQEYGFHDFVRRSFSLNGGETRTAA